MIQALALYADAYPADWGKIGEDYVLGAAWLDMLKGCRALLNGETGRYDCGTLDHMLVDMVKAAGFEEGDL